MYDPVGFTRTLKGSGVLRIMQKQLRAVPHRLAATCSAALQ
jgi:hypothetical protein